MRSNRLLEAVEIERRRRRRTYGLAALAGFLVGATFQGVVERLT